MIISHVIGGLGNQMFQYAVGRATSLNCKNSLRLDISSFAGYQLHQGFELSRVFNCAAEIANGVDVRGIIGWQFQPHFRRLLLRPKMAAVRRKGFVVEPHFKYWGGIKDIPCDCYLYGYWQSEKYFSNVAAQIRTDFTFRIPLDKQNAELAKHINEVEAVSLHTRRGDYANNPKTTAMHGLCSLDYYQSAIKYVSDNVEQPFFFIFSDDIAWVKNNLKIDFPCQYVNHNQGAESYNDMRLMSMCQHHIIANSSFSWWGAWLNQSMDKIVVAPKQWFASQIDAPDVIPQEWASL